VPGLFGFQKDNRALHIVPSSRRDFVIFRHVRTPQ
jgi:hypothetical protein